MAVDAGYEDAYTAHPFQLILFTPVPGDSVDVRVLRDVYRY